ncbi:MAG: lipoyl synthase [Thermodesulfovibrionia bacterium]|nr:lipoyl synthase [Thermodesulfovibrionia bacterium]
MRHPEWLKVQLSGTHQTKKILRHYRVSTVCEEAKCPNQGKCFSSGTTTFMILGDRCTRNCSFCAVESNSPLPLDPDEPERIAEAASTLGLKFVVITSVTRDDLPDGGAGHFAKTIQALKLKNETNMLHSNIKNNENNPPLPPFTKGGMGGLSGEKIKIEVLTPDFKGDLEALRTVLNASPDVFNHNVETIPRLYATVRPKADYLTSINILHSAKILYPHIKTKSGIMLGFGEKDAEVLSVLRDLRDAGCDFLTIGQYLRPRKGNIPVVDYIRPEVFEHYKIKALEMGFKAVASSPMARSSMNAEEMYSKI